jgi:hypothetical protein
MKHNKLDSSSTNSKKIGYLAVGTYKISIQTENFKSPLMTLFEQHLKDTWKRQHSKAKIPSEMLDIQLHHN